MDGPGSLVGPDVVDPPCEGLCLRAALGRIHTGRDHWARTREGQRALAGSTKRASGQTEIDVGGRSRAHRGLRVRPGDDGQRGVLVRSEFTAGSRGRR